MAIALDSNAIVTIYGGSGFIGRYVVQALARTGCRMRVAVRRPELAGHLQPLGGVGQIHAVAVNIRDDASVRRAAAGADAVVNLVGVLAEGGRQSFKALQAEGARRIAWAASEAGCRMMVQMSAIGADRAARSAYARTKGEGEDSVLAVLPQSIILRPSLVFGAEDQFFNRFAGLARYAPALPLIGGGRTRFQPVYVGDVARAVVAALGGTGRPGTIYELGGPKIHTFRELLEYTLAVAERPRPFVSVPFWAAKLQAGLTQWLPGAPLTVDQVRLLATDTIVSDAATREARTLQALGIEPQALEAIVPGYLVRFRPKGEFSARAA